MPSWNIHTAHAEHLTADYRADALGIYDANAFLFGSYVPDIYLGFVVPNPSFRIDYCMTHMARPNVIPVPDADRFWDTYVARHWTLSPTELSLLLGSWAHLVADREYNNLFRTFCETHETPQGEQLRMCKQADFDTFGRSLGISHHVRVSSKLVEAARMYRPYMIAEIDVKRTVEVADRIVRESAVAPTCDEYQLLGSAWMSEAFTACNDFLAAWLQAWQRLYVPGQRISASIIRSEAGLPSELPEIESD